MNIIYNTWVTIILQLRDLTDHQNKWKTTLNTRNIQIIILVFTVFNTFFENWGLMDLKKVENNILQQTKKGMKEHNSFVHFKDRNCHEKLSQAPVNFIFWQHSWTVSMETHCSRAAESVPASSLGALAGTHYNGALVGTHHYVALVDLYISQVSAKLGVLHYIKLATWCFMQSQPVWLYQGNCITVSCQIV